MSKLSLAETHPELAKEWHPTKNGELTPGDVTPGSSKMVWWKCDKEVDHEWQTTVGMRTIRNTQCPCCSGRKVVKSNSLLLTKPEIAKEWHPTKNGSLTPLDVTIGMRKSIWWKCDKGSDHIWEATLANRQKSGCPICYGRKAVLSNSLLVLNPQLAKQWHPTKNNNLKPSEVTPGSAKKVWWQCDKADDHEWQTAVNDRALKNGGCPCCSGQKTVLSNCLETTHPELSIEWHPTKNEKLTSFDVIAGSTKKVWWKCDVADDHEWRASISSRTSHSTGCPCCSGLKAVLSNCLETTHPKLSKEWHPSKNGNLKPTNFVAGSHKKVWWRCSKGDDHEWETSIVNRGIEGSGCLICAGKKVVLSNCLQTTHPKIAKTWHPTKNGKRTPLNVTFGSDKKYWWKCDNGDDHVWETKLNNRIRGDCPFCTLTPQSKQELIITFELKTIFKNIDPKGFKTILDGQLRSIDIFIPLLKLAIEFDGSYWHKDKDTLDKIKSELLVDEGYKVIRIREEPLKKIHENDIVSTHPYNGKQITDNILKRILETYDIFKIPMLNKMYEYLKKDSLQNEKGLDRYIDQILTEKAEKREQLH